MPAPAPARPTRAVPPRPHRTAANAAAAAGVFAAAALLAAAAGRPAAAQPAAAPDPQCADPAAVGPDLAGGQACQLAVDLFRYLNPQLGMLVAGGNATLGQVGTLGGPGRLKLGLRLNATPEFGLPSVGDGALRAGPARAATYGVRRRLGAFPVADLAVGVYRGARWGGRRVGAVDAVLTPFWVPKAAERYLNQVGASAGDARYTVGLPASRFRLGYGARLGVVDESRFLPAVALTYVRRDLPTLDLGYVAGAAGDALPNGATPDSAPATGAWAGARAAATGAGADSIALSRLAVRTAAWRLVVGKTVGRALRVAAGAGQDRYRSDGALRVAFTDADGTRARAAVGFGQAVTRTNVFADVALRLGPLRVEGEIGQVTGGRVATYNRFSTPADAPRRYGRIGFGL